MSVTQAKGKVVADLLALIAAAQAAATAAQAASQLPIGSVIMLAVATNPGTLLGYGMWNQIGGGRFIVGAGSVTDVNGDVFAPSLAAIGGEINHLLTINEMPAHSHDLRVFVRDIDGGSPDGDASVKASSGLASGYMSNTGGGQKHNNLPPYLALNLWQRVG